MNSYSNNEEILRKEILFLTKAIFYLIFLSLANLTLLLVLILYPNC